MAANDIHNKRATYHSNSPKDNSWVNWYISRGRLPHNPTRRDLRALSNRRVF